MATEYTDTDPRRNRAQDFIVRERFPSTIQLLALYFIALVSSLFMVIYFADRFHIALAIATIMGFMAWYFVTQVQRNRDQLLATEFQNALFSSALGINNKFCIIIRNNGTIVYLDRMFQEMFPDFLRLSQRNIETLMVLGKVSNEDSEKVFRAIAKGVYEKVIFDICDVHGHGFKIVMSVEPILRPSGFIMLRGREFVEKRKNLHSQDTLTPPDLMDRNTMALFSYIMDTMNMGVYMTSPSSQIVYVNPVLEQWLGYGDNEINSSNLSLQDIFYQDGKRLDTVEPNDFMGEILLKQKDGTSIKSFLNQKIIRDEQHKVIGCTALLHNLGIQAAPKRKKAS